MKIIEWTAKNGKRVDYYDYGKAIPPYPKSEYIIDAQFEKYRYHQGVGDMWPLTWGMDDNIYTAGGDNRSNAMNFWRVKGEPGAWRGIYQDGWALDCINELPLDPIEYCKDPRVHRTMGLKPAGLLDIRGTLFFAVSCQNYGVSADKYGYDISNYTEEHFFNRQTNINGWIIVSRDYGKTWQKDATPMDFFTGRLASCHFLQFGKGYKDTRGDGYVYAYFNASDESKSYWENGDYMLLGRVPAGHWFICLEMLNRQSWEFYIGMDENNNTIWSKDDNEAIPVFRYNKMTGENHVSYNKDIKRYILGNYGFVDEEVRPRPNHQGIWPESALRSQLTLYEAPEPWGPWSLFYQDDNWGTYGNYQPSFPTKWMYNNGRTMWMVSSGTFDDYNFCVQRLDIKVKDD